MLKSFFTTRCARMRRLAARILAHRWFLLIFALAIIARVSVLLRSQRWADGDESVVGVMALHLLRQGVWPIYFLGQPYGGGAAIEADLAAASFGLFGVSSVSLKMVPLLFSLIALCFFYLAADRAWGRSAALWVAACLTAASPLIEWNFKARGGYAEIPLFTALIFFLLTKLGDEPRARLWELLLLGFTMGFAYYSLELIVPLFVAIFVYVAIIRPDFARPRGIVPFTLGTLLGLLPCLLYNWRYQNLNFRFIYQAAAHSSWNFESLQKRAFEHFPKFFQAANVDGYPDRIALQAVVETCLYMGAALVAAFVVGRRLQKKFELATLCLIQVLVQLPIILMSARIDDSPRYFLPVFFPILLLACFAVAQMARARRHFLRWVGYCAGASLLLFGAISHARYMHDALVTDDVPISPERLVNVKVRGDSIEKIIALLRTTGVTYARAPYFVLWRIDFESQEKIIAASGELHPSDSRYLPYARAVRLAKTSAVILHKRSWENERFRGLPDYDLREVDDYNVYVPRARAP